MDEESNYRFFNFEDLAVVDDDEEEAEAIVINDGGGREERVREAVASATMKVTTRSGCHAEAEIKKGNCREMFELNENNNILFPDTIPSGVLFAYCVPNKTHNLPDPPVVVVSCVGRWVEIRADPLSNQFVAI